MGRRWQLIAKHLQSLIYLGHRRLAKKKYTEALDFYTQALDIWPGSPSAFYNRALIINKLGRTPEEIIAWLDYLEQYPVGTMAHQATDYLNLGPKLQLQKSYPGRAYCNA